MIHVVYFIYECINTPFFVCATIALSCVIKLYLLTIIVPLGLQVKIIHKPLLFLLGTLIGSIFGDVSWILKLVRTTELAPIPFSALIFWIRLSWALLILQYQSLAFFIESLTHKNFIFRPIHTILALLSSGCALYFIAIAFFDNSLTDLAERSQALAITDIAQAPLEMRMMHYVDCYLLHVLIASGLLLTFINFYTKKLPKILTIQLKTVLLYFICPYIIVEALQALLVALLNVDSSMYCIVAWSTLLITYSIYFCIQRIMVLRFLNVENHVQSSYQKEFFNNFKITLEQLSHVTTTQELGALTQTFFKAAFAIPSRNTTLYVRNQHVDQQVLDPSSNQTLIESFMHTHDTATCKFIQHRRILIYDELEFSNFYADHDITNTILSFMDTINAGIFLPIYDRDTMIAYILVEKNARAHLYGNVEHDEMLIFANYLGSIINLLQHRNLTTLMYKEKELKEELFLKQQEISQYKESLKSFLRTSSHKEIGIIFYKYNRFIFGNKTAKIIVDANHYLFDGLPLSKAIQKVAHQVTTYKAQQTTLVPLKNNQKLIIYGVPNIEQNTTIIMLYHPEISDILTRNISLLKDPSTWDYLLYLETTRSGQLINQLIPGTGEELLNFKLELLKTALCQKAILLEMSQEDLMSTVEIIHHISLRQVLHVMSLNAQNSREATLQLFGSNPIISSSAIQPLLGKLDNIGTLFIQNIELLELKTQQELAEFLMYGSYRLYGSQQRSTANVRIICSTKQNLQTLVREGTFCKKLFDELNKTFLSMPSLATLPEQELSKLAEGLAYQSIKHDDLKNIVTLTDKEKNKIALKRPSSLYSLKTRIEEIVHEKSKKSLVYQEIQLKPIPSDNPELVTALALGKKALRDPHIMAMLWKKFKNQNQIATFLGVNRSSINRRCKEYGLQ